MSSFSDLGLSAPLLRTLDRIGFVKPTPIQAQAIPVLLEGERDLVGLASTGTGKTAAFGLPILQSVDASAYYPQALVIAPTRELCIQITKELEQFAKELPHLSITPVYGGADIGRQMRSIKKGTQVVVATPGRLRDLIRRRAIRIDQIKYVVLDEADEMLNMGFKEEIDDILQHTPDTKRTWLFSATMPPDVRRIAQEYMQDPVEVRVDAVNETNADIDHQYVITRPSERYDVICRYLDAYPDLFGLVFCRTRRETQELSDQLSQAGYAADSLHGDLSQSQRDRVMDRFRHHHLRLLIATDVAARGIDVQDITHVIHCNIPDDKAFYTHRSGRTGRAGSKGVSLILCHPRDQRKLRDLDRKKKLNLTHAHVPTDRQIVANRILAELKKLAQTEPAPAIVEIIEEFAPVWQGLSREELVQRLATQEWQKLGKRYRHFASGKSPYAPPKQEKRKMKTQRLFINVGRLEITDIPQFLEFMETFGHIDRDDIGRVDLHEKHTFFELNIDRVKKVMNAFRRAELHGRPLRVNPDDHNHGGGKKFYKKEKKSGKKKKHRKYR